VGRPAGSGKGVLLAVGFWAATAAGCGGVVRRGDLDDDGSSGQAGNGPVPPVGGAAGVGTAGFGGSAGTTQPGGASGLGGGGSNGIGGTGGRISNGGSGGIDGFFSCGTHTCGPVNFPGGRLPVCCPEPNVSYPSTPRCGVDMGSLNGVNLEFHESCQPKHQPSAPDAACESLVVSARGDVSTQQGCCRTDVGICGFQVDRIGSGPGQIDLELGCVSATVSLVPRPVTPCGQAPRPHYLLCECTDGTTHEFCLAAGCASGIDQSGVCAQACGGWENRSRLGCSDDYPRCR
jgi:hypothetical protein